MAVRNRWLRSYRRNNRRNQGKPQNFQGGPRPEFVPQGPKPTHPPTGGKGPKGPGGPRPNQPPAGGPQPPLQPKPPAPAPVQPENELARQRARDEFNMQQADTNRRLYQAALNYGDVGEVNRLAGLGYGARIDENAGLPMGTLAGIKRQLETSREDLGNLTNENNLFFSGSHLKDRADLSRDAGFAQAGAMSEYQEAAAELASLIARAQAERDAQIAEADLADLRAFEATTPEPKAYGPGGRPGNPGGGKGKDKGKKPDRKGDRYKKGKKDDDDDKKKRRRRRLRKKKPKSAKFQNEGRPTSVG